MSRLRRDDGFTLMELVVSAAVGSIVMLGAFTIVDQALPAGNRVADRVVAQGRGRAALEQVLGRVRSVVCVPQNNGATFQSPFAATTNDTTLTFFVNPIGSPTGPTDPAVVNTFQPEKHVLQFSGTQLTEQTYAGQFVSPNWTWPSLSATRVVLTNVQQSAATPYFKYYAPDAPNTPLATPVSSADLPRINRVEVTMLVGPGRTTVSGTGSYAALNGSATVQIPVDFTDATSTAKGPQCSF